MVPRVSETERLNPLVPISNKNRTVSCDGTATGRVELAIAFARFAKFGDEAAIRSEDLHAMIVGVADICVVVAVKCECTVGRTVRALLHERCQFCAETFRCRLQISELSMRKKKHRNIPEYDGY